MEQRKPKTIIQLDCERIRILDDGTIDENYEHAGMHLAANRMWLSEANQKLSGPSYKRILNALFK